MPKPGLPAGPMPVSTSRMRPAERTRNEEIVSGQRSPKWRARSSTLAAANITSDGSVNCESTIARTSTLPIRMTSLVLCTSGMAHLLAAGSVAPASGDRTARRHGGIPPDLLDGGFRPNLVSHVGHASDCSRGHMWERHGNRLRHGPLTDVPYRHRLHL